MPVNATTPEQIIPIVAAFGFAIQQLTQVIFDPIASIIISIIKARNGNKLPYGITDVDAKKTLLGLVSLAFGILVASTDTIHILKAVGLDLPGWDFFVTAVTLSAGVEGTNSVVKLVQYIKDAVKAQTPPSVAQNSPAPQSPANIMQ